MNFWTHKTQTTPLLARVGQADQAQGHLATGTFAVCGLPQLVAPYADLHVPGFAKVAPPYPFRDRDRGTDEELVQRRARELRQAIVAEGPETVSAVIMEPVISSRGFIIPPVG